MNRTLRPVVLWTALAAFGWTLTATTPAEAKHAKQGYIYGKVSTRTGNAYTGILRWDTEEAFWDDLFHSNKEDLPYTSYVEKATSSSKDDIRDLEQQLKRAEREEDRLKRDYEKLADRLSRAKRDQEREELRQEQLNLIEQRTAHAEARAKMLEELARRRENSQSKSISVLGGALRINWNDWDISSRIFIARFGDISKITVIGSEDAELVMRDGSKYTVSGYSNDVGGPIKVRDAALGDITVDWRKIDTIEFMETPKNIEPEGYRIHGKVYTDSGVFDGFIQWDSEECLSTDKLDGDSEDGRLSIDFGSIRTIERRSRSSSKVTLKDGRSLLMEGTNDVDGSIRGIMVETPNYGRVKVPWDAFDRAELDDDTGESGMAYGDYAKQWKLNGTVTNSSGETFSGRIVFDIDESESWEILNGDQFDVEFNIPFAIVKAIEPRSRNFSMVSLSTGETIRLEGGQDVSDSNDGVLIFTKGEKEDPTYLRWDEIEKIDFNLK